MSTLQETSDVTKSFRAIEQPQNASSREYIFDNRGDQAAMRFRDLSHVYDARTIDYIKRLGVADGWSCLEVGAGAGSIAHWLSLRVGDTGRVLATDIETRFLELLARPNLEVRRHDLCHEPLPEKQFDLAHARLVLMHLPERESALRRMVAALKPGGWIMVEEFDDLSLLPDPAAENGELNNRIRNAVVHVASSKGVDLGYGRSLPRMLQANGLVRVGSEANLSLWRGGTAGGRLARLTYEELRRPILASGLISEEDFEAAIERTDDEDFAELSPMLWTAWGQRPHQTETKSRD